MFVKIDADGAHNEAYWSSQFGALYQWLFQNESLSTNIQQQSAPNIFQNNTGNIVASGLANPITFKVYNMQGQAATTITLVNGVNAIPEQLAKGIYILKAVNNTMPALKIIKR